MVHLALARKAPTYITSYHYCMSSFNDSTIGYRRWAVHTTNESKIRRKSFPHISTKSLELSTPRNQTGSLYKQLIFRLNDITAKGLERFNFTLLGFFSYCLCFTIYLRQRRRNMFSPASVFVCLCARLLKTREWIWMKCCVSTDVETWTNWLTFDPDPDHSPDTGTECTSSFIVFLTSGWAVSDRKPLLFLYLYLYLWR